ncbi:MAG: SGNH/GDSL hydrolase family protein [Ruminococcaceae bacterium]|nr:SGNH/GDSL hydrolase family protein [Oscillospiraceae bacterium]
MKRFVLLLLMLTLALAGCNGGGEGVATSDQTETPEGETTAAPETTVAPETTAASEEAKPLDPNAEYNILFVGNSYTYFNEMPSVFLRLCQQNGYGKVHVNSVTNGGWTLLQHASPADLCGKKIVAELEKGIYDYVILQEQSTRPVIDTALFYDGARAMVEKIRAAGAEPIFYQTWGRKEGHSFLKEYKETNESMTWKLAAAYHAIGEELSVPVAPVGYAFFDVHTAKGDTINLYDPDLTHPSKNGSYLAALTIMTKLFGADPTTFTVRGLEDDVVKTLTEAAKKAVLETPELPDEYKTSSVGVFSEQVKYAVDASQMAQLKKAPESEIISLISGNPPYPSRKRFCGILGSKGAIASKEYSTTALTDAQKADIADIGYGVSVIGIERMDSNSSGYKTAVENLVNGEWGGGTMMSNLYFDDKRYDINGNVDENGLFTALITLNFGKLHTFDAFGFCSGSLQGFPGAAEVYVSDDGKSWTRVPTACWDALNVKGLAGISNAPTDPWNSKAPGTCALFDMGGIGGQYIRLGIAIGRYDASDKNNTINTREIIVYGAEK